MKSIVVGFWPYADDPKYDKRIEMLERQVSDAMKAGVSQKQVDAAFEGAVNESGSVLKWFQVATNKLGELKWSEKRRCEGPARQFGKAYRPSDPEEAIKLPWRSRGMNFSQWVKHDKGNAKDVIRKNFSKRQAEGLCRMIDKNMLLESDYALALTCAKELVRMPDGHIFD